MTNPVDAGDEEGYNQNEVAVDPDVVGEVVVEVPVYLHHFLLFYAKFIGSVVFYCAEE